MAENRCLLTQEGRSALEQLLKQVYPSKGLNKSQIQRDTRLSRETLNRIFNCPYKPVQKRCLEDLFERLNRRLEENHKAQNQPQRGEDPIAYEGRMKRTLQHLCITFKEIYCTEELKEVRSAKVPAPPAQSQPLPVSLVETVPFPAALPENLKELDTRLRNLNYTTGQARFQESLKRLKPAGAFLLQVGDTKVQRWLVRRLAQQVLGFENGKRAEINVALLGENSSSSGQNYRGSCSCPIKRQKRRSPA